jgi:predicted NUDIX family phosphoesterase
MNPKKKLDEKILVVPAKKLFPETPVTGFCHMEDFEHYANLISSNKEFQPRTAMEVDQTYKQVIPYLIFSYQNKFFLMQRKSSASEQRLKNKYTLGIGGHIREEDITGKNIIDWAKREFEEEIDYSGSYTIQSLGIINDDSNDVGKVHTGFAFIMHGTSDNIKIRSELKEGKLVTLEECEEYYDNMETWSQLAFKFLKQQCQQKK